VEPTIYGDAIGAAIELRLLRRNVAAADGAGRKLLPQPAEHFFVGGDELLGRIDLGAQRRLLDGGDHHIADQRQIGGLDLEALGIGGALQLDYSATLTIGKLICKNGKLNVSYTNTLTIQYIDCSETLDIQDSYSSTIRIAVPLIPLSSNGSNIGKTTGLVRYSSLGECCAGIGRDEVRTEFSSTWTAVPLPTIGNQGRSG
jgi:hypothetical protein